MDNKKIQIIKKILFFSILFCCTFFININKSFAKVIECYYLLPNSDVYINKNIFRNTNVADENNRLYYTIKVNKEKTEVKTWNGANGNEKRKMNWNGKKDEILEKCPKYLSLVADQKKNRKLKLKTTLNEENDKDYKNFLYNYYNIDENLISVEESTNIFEINNATGFKYALAYLPDPIEKDQEGFLNTDECRSDGYSYSNIHSDSCSTLKDGGAFYLPLYYYKDDNTNGEGNKCYLSDILNKSVTKDCTITYQGEDPMKIYMDSSTKAYAKISNDAISNFKTQCTSGKTGSFNENINDIIGYAKDGSNYKIASSVSENCKNASKNLGRLADAYHKWYSSFNLGDSNVDEKSFKSYQDYYEEMMESNKNDITSFNFLIKIMEGEGLTSEEMYNYLYQNEEEEVKATEAKNAFEDSNACNFVTKDEYGQKVCKDEFSSCLKNSEYTKCQKEWYTGQDCYKLYVTGCMEKIYSNWDECLKKKDEEANEKLKDLEEYHDRMTELKSEIIDVSVDNPLYGRIGFGKSEGLSCDDVIAVRVIWIIIEIGAPILVVALGILDFAKAVVAGDESKISKAKQQFPKRIIVLAILLILPLIIKSLVGLIDDSNVNNLDLVKCIINGEKD